MPRTPTTTNTTVEWEERVTDPDSDSLTLSLVLDAVDDGSGFTSDGTDSSNLSWLSFTKTANTLNDGTLENLVNIVADKSGLTQGYKYRFKITADDGTTAVPRTFTLNVRKPPSLSGEKFYQHTRSESGYFTLSTPYDLDTATSQKQSISNANGRAQAHSISPNGKKWFQADRKDGSLWEFTLSTRWDISTASVETQIGLTSLGSFAEFNAVGLTFTNGGKTLVVGSNGGKFIQLTLGTPYDISTYSVDANLDKPFNGRQVGQCRWGMDGKRFYEGDEGSGTIYQTDIGTAYDLTSTKTAAGSYSNGSIYPRHLLWRPNGEEVVLIEGVDVVFGLYSVSTPWDIA